MTCVLYTGRTDRKEGLAMECRVKELREKLGMTQEDLAKKAGVSRNLISMLENGKDVNITKRTMQALSKALDTPINNIFLL